MRSDRIRRRGVVGIAIAAGLLAGAVPADAAPGDGSAYGARVNVTLLNQPLASVGPLAQAHTLPRGPQRDTLASVNVPGLLRARVVDTRADRDASSGVVTSAASIADVRIGALGPRNLISASAVTATCTASQKGIVGSARLVNLDLGSLGDVSADPAPNTVVEVRAPVLNTTVARIVFNEQIRNKDGSRTVNALHVTLYSGVRGSLGSGDIVLSSATCGPAAPPIPLASGTGLWLGLGLLGLVAVPAVAALRRRGQNAMAG